MSEFEQMKKNEQIGL